MKISSLSIADLVAILAINPDELPEDVPDDMQEYISLVREHSEVELLTRIKEINL